VRLDSRSQDDFIQILNKKNEDNCNNVIIEYYDDGYRGNRGKCIVCNIDFPLE